MRCCIPPGWRWRLGAGTPAGAPMLTGDISHGLPRLLDVNLGHPDQQEAVVDISPGLDPEPDQGPREKEPLSVSVQGLLACAARQTPTKDTKAMCAKLGDVPSLLSTAVLSRHNPGYDLVSPQSDRTHLTSSLSPHQVLTHCFDTVLGRLHVRAEPHHSASHLPYFPWGKVL
jgi:hypothetical protein